MRIINFYKNLDKRLDGKLSIWLVFFIIPFIFMLYVVIATDFSVNHKDGTPVGLWLDMLMAFVGGILTEAAILFSTLMVWLTLKKTKEFFYSFTDNVDTVKINWNSFVRNVKGAAQDELTESKVKFD